MMSKEFQMSEKTIHYIPRNVNLRRDVCDLIEGECNVRKNGERGFSLTINQIILEYFEIRTPKGAALAILGGEFALTLEKDGEEEL
jgi:hypothetical protein